jgi:hypothetical protein
MSIICEQPHITYYSPKIVRINPSIDPPIPSSPKIAELIEIDRQTIDFKKSVASESRAESWVLPIAIFSHLG